MGRFDRLTDREIEVWSLMAEGKTDREIAEYLVISDKTASKHVHNILRKLGVSNRTEATALYWQRRLSQIQLQNT